MKIIKNFKINGRNIIIREVRTEMKDEPYLCGYVEITKDNKYNLHNWKVTYRVEDETVTAEEKKEAENNLENAFDLL